MTTPDDPLVATSEFEADDAGYAWWRNTHPSSFVLAVRARKPPMLHRASCDKVDRDRHPGSLGARGSRQICAETKVALRAWLARESPADAGPVERCPKCAP
jgi:hypothetical protein